MSAPDCLQDNAEDLFEHAPCGYVSMLPDGTIVRVNRTFEELTGLDRASLAGRRRFQELLTPGGRIYHETHLAPLLAMQGFAREIAVEIVRADGTRMPVLVNSVLRRDEDGTPRGIRTVVFEATDRRRYEEELLRGREREHDVAVALQRSMLSGALPQLPGFELGVAYVPAERGLEVGGDWYDAFWVQEDQTIGLVVGDIVGRGIHAAATMGQLRSAVRALASTRLSPAGLLEATDVFARRHGVGEMTTLVHAQVDADGAARYACAGHPPPVLVMPAAAPAFLWDGRSLPLDAQEHASARAQAAVDLVEGATLLLYTDGLVERSGRALDEGTHLLLETVDRLRELAPAQLTEALVAELAPMGARADDVCALALRRVATSR